MNDKKINRNNQENPPFSLKNLKQMNRRTRYINYERDSGKGRRKIEKFEDGYTRDPSSDILIEDLIAARNMHIALDKALQDLSADEYEIISECFFEGKVNYTKLAKKHGITRQAYTKKLKHILKMLKKLVISYYEDF